MGGEIFFFISDYFSAYRVILGNYCSSWGSGLGSDSWVLIPALPVDEREWEGPTIRTLARLATSGDYLVKEGSINCLWVVAQVIANSCFSIMSPM